MTGAGVVAGSAELKYSRASAETLGAGETASDHGINAVNVFADLTEMLLKGLGSIMCGTAADQTA